MVITPKHSKVVEKFVEKIMGKTLIYWIDICCRCTLELPKCEPTTYVTKIKETYFEIYTKQVACPLALPLLNISNCQLVLKHLSNCLYLHDSCITKFDFMNYAFAKLVVAWLYVTDVILGLLSLQLGAEFMCTPYSACSCTRNWQTRNAYLFKSTFTCYLSVCVSIFIQHVQ